MSFLPEGSRAWKTRLLEELLRVRSSTAVGRRARRPRRALLTRAVFARGKPGPPDWPPPRPRSMCVCSPAAEWGLGDDSQIHAVCWGLEGRAGCEWIWQDCSVAGQ